MKKYLAGICLLSFGCRPCADSNFKAKFQNQIEKLELLKFEGVSLQNSTDSIDVASQTVFLITGVKPKILRNFSYAYYEDDFKNDSIKWSNWYEQNKCNVNEAFFDSIYLKAKVTYQEEPRSR